MNEFKPIPGRKEAVIEYYSGDYRVVRDGTHVVCAVTGVDIPLDALRYWSFEVQEAYATPDAMLKRHKEIAGQSS